MRENIIHSAMGLILYECLPIKQIPICDKLMSCCFCSFYFGALPSCCPFCLLCISHNPPFSITVICAKYVSSKNVGTDELSYLSTFENIHGVNCARAVTATTNGSTRPLRTHTWNSNSHEIINKTTRKTNIHDFIIKSQHIN